MSSIQSDQDIFTERFLEGDLAIVMPVDISTLHIGDVLVYHNGGIDVIHRVISIQQTGGQIVVTVKGDNNRYPDPAMITSSTLVGKVVSVIFFMGYLVQKPFNYIIAVALILLLMIDYVDGLKRSKAPLLQSQVSCNLRPDARPNRGSDPEHFCMGPS